MSSNPRKRNESSRKSEEDSRTTADTTPALASMIQNLSAGANLEQRLSQAFALLGQPFEAAGVSLSWSGAQRLVNRVTALGCYLEMQAYADHSHCRIFHVLKGNAIAKQLASMNGTTLPEAIAKAALLTLVEMQPPSTSRK